MTINQNSAAFSRGYNDSLTYDRIRAGAGCPNAWQGQERDDYTAGYAAGRNDATPPKGN